MKTNKFRKEELPRGFAGTEELEEVQDMQAHVDERAGRPLQLVTTIEEHDSSSLGMVPWNSFVPIGDPRV